MIDINKELEKMQYLKDLAEKDMKNNSSSILDDDTMAVLNDVVEDIKKIGAKKLVIGKVIDTLPEEDDDKEDSKDNLCDCEYCTRRRELKEDLRNEFIENSLELGVDKDASTFMLNLLPEEDTKKLFNIIESLGRMFISKSFPQTSSPLDQIKKIPSLMEDIDDLSKVLFKENKEVFSTLAKKHNVHMPHLVTATVLHLGAKVIVSNKAKDSEALLKREAKDEKLKELEKVKGVISPELYEELKKKL